MRHNVNVLIIWLALFMCSLSQTAIANTTFSVDKSSATVNEPITLTIESNSQSAAVDQSFIDALKQHVTIVSQSNSKRFSMINGTVQQSAALILVLQAKQPGTFSIPALGNSPSIDIKITDVNAQSPSSQLQSQNTNSAAYVETLLDKTNIFVQEQAVLTVRLFSIHPIMESNYQPPDIPGMEIAQLVSAKYDDNVNGQHYYIHEYKYALFSKHSGSIEVPSTYLKARIVDNRNINNRMFNFNVGRIINVKAPMGLLEVKPVPDHVTGEWLPASNVTITNEWSADLNTLTVGDTVERTVKLYVTSAVPSHVNPPTYNNVDGLKIYPETASKDLLEVDTGVETYLQQKVSYVLTESARHTLEPISVQWWNTNTNKLETTTLPAQQMTVRTAAGSINNTKRSSTVAGVPSAPTPASQTDTNTPQVDASTPTSGSIETIFRWGLTLLVLCLLATLAAWWLRAKRRITPSVSEAEFTFDELSNACDGADLKRMQRELIAWGRFAFKGEPIHTLSDLTQQVASSSLKQQLTLLDSALFSSRSPNNLNPKKIASLAQREQPSATMSSDKSSASSLPTLYPK
ncbi:MAG: BatD family protein [Pseudomonadota bacterium]